MKKKKHSIGVQNDAAISRMPLTDNARKIQTEATKPKGTTLIQVSMEQSLIVIQDPVNLEQEQQQDAMLSVKSDKQLWDLTDDESVMSIGSSGEDSCTEVTPITIDALKDNTSAVDRVSSQNAAANCDNTTNVRKPLERYLEKRRLIKAVKKRRVLYDTKHSRFHDRDFKNEVWRCIARRLSMDMETCVDIWNELRYEFQCHKREMLNYKQKIARHRPAGRRPYMVLEEEMCFLYPHVASYPLLREKNPAESVNAPAPAPEDDVVLVHAAQPMAIIDLDLDNESFRITPVKRRLIEAVRHYPQLYNASNISYNNYHHRGLIWGAISNELGDKATKLMKSWIILLTRYEWEVSRGPDESSELMKLMVFLIPHIPHMKESVYKTSKYLTAAWHYPIENFRSVGTLIKLMKGYTELVQLTEEYLHHKVKPPAYHNLWKKVAAQAMSTPETCEVTWLVLRSFHSELVEMRLASYNLNDKWLFENTINEIYKTIVDRTVKREGNKPDEPDPAIRTPMVRVSLLDTRTEELLKTAKITPRMSLAIAYPSAPTTTSSSSTSTITNPTSVSSSSSSTTTTPTSTATTVPSTVSSSPCSTILKNDGLKFMNTLSMAGRNSTLVMSANTAPGVLNGKPVPKAFVVRRPVPLPVQAPAHEIRSWMTMQTASAPPVRVAINQTSVPDPPTTPLTASSMTAPSGALKRKRSSITVNGEGTGSSETGKETEIESNVHKWPAIANTRLQMQIISKIKVELLSDGNSLHVHGGALITDYNLHKERVGMLIREVMDIPILHNNNPKLESKKSELWGNVARKLHMPADACRATWKFLSENISLFPAIAPMPDLMGLHKGYAKNWEKSERVFKVFEEVAAKNQWIKIRHQLPLLMIHFRMFEHLYSDMRRPRPGEILQSPRVYIQKQSDDVWRVAKAKFPDINHMEVWSTFKLAFRTYMDDLEMGIENPWPRLWWQAFDQLRFLVNVRYHPLEPYYYIVHTKIRAEVKRCSIYEKFMPTRQPDLSPKLRALGSQVRIDWEPLPWETEEARRLLTGKLRADTVSRPYVKAPPPATATAAFPAKAVCSAPAKVVFSAPAACLAASACAPIASPAPAPGKLGVETVSPYVKAPPPATATATSSAKAVCSAPAKIVSPAPAACPAASACAPVASPAPAPGKLGVDTVSPYVKAPPPATATAASPAKAVCSAPPAFPAKPAPPACAPIASPAPSVSPATAHAPATSLSLAQSLVPPRRLVLVSKEYKGGTMPDVKCNGQPLQTSPILQCATQRLLPILPAFEMTTMLKQYPNTFRQATTHEKRTAWVQTATELNTTVIGCRMSMQHALRESRILKIADPTNKCQLGQSYYRHINDMYSEVKPEAQPVRISQLLVRTPEQLNQTQIEGAATLGTRRFMPEISMSNAHPRLVLKNWSHALATFSPESQQKLFGKLTNVFAKHALASSESIAKIEVIEGSHTNHTNFNL
ncbi:uncharacterized protein DMAD_00860 [Drosophila madeirensis]|uniref:MADF domain-containing protein n=1 Tax=Drosophila madeirensis TaxID=30013 RepID=A0AAU9FXW0_DROMD